jgi:hypothetical protein
MNTNLIPVVDPVIEDISPRCKGLFFAWYACERNATGSLAGRPYGCWLPRRVYEACERIVDLPILSMIGGK